jgi:hypothetical protein
VRPSSGAAERLLSDRLGAKRDQASARGRRYGPCARLSSATCTPTVRPRRSTSPGGGSPSAAVRGQAVRHAGRRAGARRNWTASLDGPWPTAPRRRLGRAAGSACCPISTPTSSWVSPGIACTGRGRRPRGGVTAWRQGPVIAGCAAAPYPPPRVLAPEPLNLGILAVPASAGGHRVSRQAAGGRPPGCGRGWARAGVASGLNAAGAVASPARSPGSAVPSRPGSRICGTAQREKTLNDCSRRSSLTEIGCGHQKVQN